MLRSRPTFLLVAALVSARTLPPASAAEPPPPDQRLETGALNDVQYVIAHPAHWNRRLLLVAHTQRPASRPLRVELDPRPLDRATLLAEGWMIAATSYRRNGLIVTDAIADLDALRSHIARNHGAPERVLLEGTGMGGLVATLIAERDPAEPPLYDAVVAIGATLSSREPHSSLGITLRPKIPLLFLAHPSEFEAFRHYVEATASFDEPNLRPVLYRIVRDGSANVNERERLFALRSLNLWLDQGRTALPRPPAGTAYFDATIPPEPQPSRIALHPDHRGFDAHVIAISPDTGDVTLDAQPSDFAVIGLGKTARFQVSAHGQTHRATYARPIDRRLRSGEWLAFATADGFCLLVRHRDDAAATARLSVGDTVTFRRYPASSAP